jgi:hypothetical protein
MNSLDLPEFKVIGTQTNDNDILYTLILLSIINEPIRILKDF